MLSLTLSWTFKLTALWVSCKAGAGLGARRGSLQLLCAILELCESYLLHNEIITFLTDTEYQNNMQCMLILYSYLHNEISF